MRRVVAHAVVAAAFAIVPSAGHYNGVVLGREVIAEHPEWSWSQASLVTIPTCHRLKIATTGLRILNDWICVSPQAYAQTSLWSRYSGPGEPYQGSWFG